MDAEHPDWLPADWKVCVRVRTSGRKDKYYINPLNDIKFNSKPEVLRYLKEAEDALKLKEAEDALKLKEAEDDLKLKKTISQKTDAEELPSGWTKEIKITKKGGKTRRDPFYVDPVSGLHFRTIQEVNCYLQTKDSGEVESKEDATNHPTEEMKDHSKSPSVVAEEQGLIDSKEDEILAGNESIKSVEKGNSLETNATGQREEKDSVGADQKQEKVTPQNKRKKSNHKWKNELPRRTSKRLARMEADSPLELETSNRATEAAPAKAQVNTIENTGKSEITTSGDFSKQKEAVKDISSVEEHEASTEAETSTVINTSGTSEINASGDFGKQKEVTKEDDKNGKDLDCYLNDLLKDPCIEFAIKMLTGAIPIEDANKVHDNGTGTSGSSSAAPSGDIWSDPCFEFAVKTLTSEIPTEDGRNSVTKG